MRRRASNCKHRHRHHRHSQRNLSILYFLVLGLLIVNLSEQVSSFVIPSPNTQLLQHNSASLYNLSQLTSMRQQHRHQQQHQPSLNQRRGTSKIMKQRLFFSALRNKGSKTSESDNINDNENQGILSVIAFVIPLLLVYISNQWSRSSLYYLVDFSSSSSAQETISTATDTITDAITHPASFYAMNLDIGFDQAQYGALASIAFTALFAITSLFAGSLADNYNRKYLTIGSTLVWALATYTTSVSTSYEEILVSRIIMGLACAFTTPCAYTLLKDTVSNSKLSFANSLYGSGVYFGGGLSSLSILFDDKFGWRNTCSSIAVYGFAVALLATLAIPNDPKQVSIEASNNKDNKIQQTTNEKKTNEMINVDDSGNDGGLFSDVQEIVGSNKRIQWLFLGSFVRFCSGLCIGVWAAPYYKLAFPTDASSYAVINAFIVGICGVSSGLLGGYFSDKSIGLVGDVSNSNGENSSSGNILSSLDENGARLIVPIVGSLLAVPTWWLTSHASTFDTAMIWLGVEYLVAECWFGPTVAVLQSEVKKGQGGTAQGLFTLTGAIGNLAPSLLGILYSRQMIGDDVTTITGSESDVLSNLLGFGVCAGYLLSALFFGLSAVTKPQSTEYETIKSS